EQELVSGDVAEAVVDRLEVVEVEEEHPEALVGVAARALDGDANPLDEERAIRQPGESVVQRIVSQLLLDSLGVRGATLQLDFGERRDGNLAEEPHLFLG